MANKVMTGILVFLVIVNIAIGAYVYLLSRDVDTLSNQLAALQADVTGQLNAVGDEVATLDKETADRFDTVEEGIESNLSGINSVGDGLDQVGDRVTALETGMANIENALAEIGPGIKADEVYQAVGQGVVEVSDGERTIGSGFLYDDDGHVVTANHVIEELDSIYIVLSDGRTSPASIVGSSSLSDVGVLALERQFDVVPLVLADSSLIRIGEPVVVIGSPFDLEGTVTTGIVSQIDRFEDIGDGIESRSVANLIQFDAPANYGNSGGPLLNAAGRFIGLVVARIGPENGDGIAYAVSSNKVRRVADAIIGQGYFDYPWLGVEVSDITPAAAEAAGRETVYGVLVGGVTPGGPSEAAGVSSGDIIIAIGGVPTADMADLISYLGEYGSPGDSVILEILRDSIGIELMVTLGAR